jgi:hypothetical protein
VQIHVKRPPRTVTSCNCSICRRYGALWAYYAASVVKIEAPPGGLNRYFRRNKTRAFYRCGTCGCVTHYKSRRKWGAGTIGVNANNFELEVMEGVRVRKLDGASSWTWKYVD